MAAGSERHLGGRSHGHGHESVQRTHHRWDDGGDPRGLLEEDVPRLGHSDSEAREGQGSREEDRRQTVQQGRVRRFSGRRRRGAPFGKGGGEEAQGTERARTPTSGAGGSWGSEKEDREEVARS